MEGRISYGRRNLIGSYEEGGVRNGGLNGDQKETSTRRENLFIIGKLAIIKVNRLTVLNILKFGIYHIQCV